MLTKDKSVALQELVEDLESSIIMLGVHNIPNVDWVDDPEKALLVHASRSLEVAVYNLRQALKALKYERAK